MGDPVNPNDPSGLAAQRECFSMAGWGEDARMRDAANYPSTFLYLGNLTKTTVPGGYTRFGYNDGGVLLKTMDQTGLVSKTTYAAATNYAAPSTVTSAGLTTTLNWNSWLGLTQEAGPNGETTTYGYDSYARISNVSILTALAYGYLGPNQVREEVNGRWTKKTMDGFDRVVKVEIGDAEGTKLATETEYGPCACSPLGKVKRVSKTHAPDATTVHWTTYEYDGLGRTTKVILPDGSTTRYEYAGNTVKVTDPAGKWKRMTTDAFGQIVQVNEPDPKNAGAEYVTSYRYDVLNRLVRVEMPRGTGGGSYTQVRTWAYDANEKLASVTMPETGTVTREYDTVGRLARKRDARGYRVEYAYDAKNRVTTETQYDAAGVSLGVVTYSYDTNPYNGTFTQNGTGRLTAVTYGGGYREMYSYTAQGQLVKKLLQAPVDGVLRDMSVAYTHDGEGRPGSLAYPGQNQSYSYDSLGRLASGRDGAIVYGPSGEVVKRGLQEYEYNVLGQVTRIGMKHLLIPTTYVLDLRYTYVDGQNNGQITSMTNAVSGETVSYNYDALSRLTAASSSAGWGTGWEYDGWGNRTEQVQLPGKTGIAVTSPVDAATNRLLGGYTHDAAGQVTGMPHARGTMEVRYDAAGRTSGAGAFVLYWAGIYGYQWRQTWGESYVYGPDGRRVYKKDVETGEERYYLWVGGELLAEYRPVLDANGSFVNFELVPPPDPYQVHKDRLGSNVYQQKYFPYGEAQQSASTYTFATYSRDVGTGLDYAQQRYYSSTVGRFTTPDPYMASGGVANPGSWNRYAYVEGDPVNRMDPSGLFSCGAAHPEYGPNPCVPAPFGKEGSLMMESIPAQPGDQDLLTDVATRPFGYSGAYGALSQEACHKLFGFRSAADAQRAFSAMVFKYDNLGPLTIEQDADGNQHIAKNTPPPALNPAGYNVIVINTDYQWYAFSSVIAYNRTTRGTVSVNYLNAVNNAMGTEITSVQLAQLILLHEFRHTPSGGGAPQERSFRAFNKEIVEACLK